MSTLSQQTEEGRPPDNSPGHLSNCGLKKALTGKPTCLNRQSIYDNADNLKRDSNKNSVVQKCEKNILRNSLPKLLCLKKTPANRHDNNMGRHMNTLSVSSLESLSKSYISASNEKEICDNSASCSNDNANTDNNSNANFDDSSAGNDKPRNRNSIHQNVEEALSSLLWQPYEYQNNNSIFCDNSSVSSSLSSSSSADSVADVTKSTSSSAPSSFCLRQRQRDPYSSVAHPPSFDQWHRPFESREQHSARSSATFVIVPDSLRETVEVATAACDDRDGTEAMQRGAGCNDVTGTTCQNNRISPGLLDGANTVGLPSVVPSTGTTVPRVHGPVFPNHVRHISEPATQFARYQGNNGFMPHHGNVAPSTQQQYNHYRSSSVPKSMPRNDNSPQKIQKLPPPVVTTSGTVRMHQGNVSNVNVNFYRAVPVSVVSSVPTIHCLNTLSNNQGNSVSNVQVLPLGGSFPLNNTNFQQPNGNFSQHVNINSSLNSTTTVNSTAGVFGTTQVTVHQSAQPSTNSIRIPTTNYRNTIIGPNVVVPVQQNRSTISTNTISTSTITNFLPPPPVHNINNSSQIVIQNNRGTVSTTPAPTSRLITSTVINNPQQQSAESNLRTRTFTSTEAQTDETVPVLNINETSREQRRRERRERRHNRHRNSSSHRHSIANDNYTQIGPNTTINQGPSADRLPDLLNSHLPPPYSTLPHPQVMVPAPAPLVPPPPPSVLQPVVPGAFVFTPPPPPPQPVPQPVNVVQAPVAIPTAAPPPGGFRFPFPASGFRRGRFSEEPPKGCCGFAAWRPGSLRWFIALIALVAVCCVLVGTALGAMRPAGRDHLTVSLLMIGVGIVLVTVSGIAWRLTSHDSSTCRSMLGLGSTESVDVCARRFVPRLPPSYGRPHHPYAAMMYPEFQYRPPPPSYQASMQEYRLRLLLLDRGNTPQIQAGIQNAVSPPPTYRSHAGSLLRAPLSSRRDTQSEYSCPPSYHSQNSSNRPVVFQPGSVLHSREQSITLSESNHGDAIVNVVNILGSTEEDIALDNITLDSLKMEPEASDINPVKMLLKGSQSELEGSKDGNLVTIVQTSDQSPVIVTVSGGSQENNSSVQITDISSEMEILAHL